MLVRACVLVLTLAAPAVAQTVSPGLEHANPETTAAARREIQQRIEEFLKKLGDRDAAGLRAMLAPKALIVMVHQQRDGSFASNYLTGDEFIAQSEKSAGQPKFEEPITNVIVTIDSERLAYVRANFTMVRDGKIMSSGVDQFTLVRESDGWKIASIANTSVPAKP